MLDIIKLCVFLLAIAAIAGLGVGYVNSMTAPLIQKQAEQAKKDSFKEIYPKSEDFRNESTQYMNADTNPLITEIDVAYVDGAPAGVIYMVEPKGYGGTVTILAGFDIPSKKITAIKVLSQNETPGLGAKSQDSSFQDRYKDKSAETELEVTKTPPTKENQIQAITASTITSRAVTSGVNAARDNFMSTFAKN